MKKITFSSILLGFALLANAQTVYLNETFAGTFASLSTTDGATYAPDASEWSLYTLGTSYTNAPSRNIYPTPLTYSNSGGEYILSGVGRMLDNQFKGMSDTNDNFLHYRDFVNTGATSGQIYLSFLISFTAAGGSSANTIGFSNTNTGVGFGNRPNIWRAISSSQVTFAAGSNTTVGTYTSTTYGLNQTVLVVAEVDYSTKIISIYINPTIAASKPASSDSNVAFTQTGLKALYLRGNGSRQNYFNLSGIRITDNWADAVAAKLPTPTIDVADNLLSDGTGFTANWTPDATDTRADGYDVKVYQGTSLVTTVHATGQATASTPITSLTEGTYTYEVLATLNNGTYSNSDPALSAASTRSAEVILQATGVNASAYGKAIKSVEYNTLTGVSASSAAKGLLLKKTTYADGSVKIEKEIK